MSCAQRANCSGPEVWSVLLDSKSHSPYSEYDVYAGQLARTFSLNVDSPVVRFAAALDNGGMDTLFPNVVAALGAEE